MNEYEAELARRHLINFIEATKENYKTQWFHKDICNKIDDFLHGGNDRLMIFLPPQHGKSEISSRRLPAQYIGNYPDNNVALVTYNQSFASKFNREIQRIIEEPEYKQIFDIRLPYKNENFVCNSTDIEIPNHQGSIKTVGVGGALTGNKVDLLIIDDVYKDAMQAWSPVERENVINWYSTVAETRLHNASKILIVFTRWHEEDLGGHILKTEPGIWEVISMPAILEKAEQRSETDERKIGEALWPKLHSLDKLHKIKEKNKIVFYSLYQQDPRPLEGLLYTPFKEHDRKEFGYVQCKVDVADSGTDKLCAIAYEQDEKYAYVKDILYTDEGHKVSKLQLVDFLNLNNVQGADFESNNQGNIYADDVQDLCSGLDMNVAINKFHQSKNKEARILGAASVVNDKILMPKDWSVKYPEFNYDVTRFRRLFKANAHDDGPDTLTLIAEEITGGGVNISFF